MYPLVLKLGTEKNELILLLSTFGAIGMQLLVEAAGTIVAIFFFFVSYFVSVKIHKSKEF